MEKKSMKNIRVNVNTPYWVMVDRGVLATTGACIKSLSRANKVVVITDSNVDKFYSKIVIDSINKVGFETHKFVFDAGEKSKNINTYLDIVSFLVKNNVSRNDLLVALGGGVVGDLVGFVASTYLRGVDFVQIPTTLLSIIDASVGGKTAIDIEEGKNLIGAFYQPKMVIADLNTLETLPSEEISNGLGEMAKYAVLIGGEYFDMMEDDVYKNLDTLIALSIEYKRDIVEKDEKEGNIRKFLNLGHTVAHAIEKLSGYTIPHGNAVSTGLVVMAKACNKNGLLTDGQRDRILSLIEKYNLSKTHPFSIGDIAKEIALDKKSDSKKVDAIVINAIGECEIKPIALNEIGDFLK